MMCFLCAGVMPLAVAGQTLQTWMRWTLLVCAVVISSIFGGAGDARAIGEGVQISGVCTDVWGSPSLTCNDLSPLVITWSDSSNGHGNLVYSCYFVYSENGNLLQAVGQPCLTQGQYWPETTSIYIPPFQVGIHHITVNRGFIVGDIPMSPVSQTVQVIITHAPAATTSTVASGANPSGSHDVNLYAHVTDNGPAGYPLSGTVTYKVDGADYCTTNVALDGTAGACATNLAAGTRSITATYNGNASHYLSNSDALAQVVAVAPSSITASAGTPQQTPIGTAFGATLQVQVKDASGQPVPNQTVTYNVPSSGATATLDSTTSATDNNGYAAVPATANGTPGAYVVTASVVGVGPLASFALTNQLAPNIITFPQPADKTFEDTSPLLAATASSNLTMAYTSGSATVCTVTAAGVITIVTAGVCSITASQAGDGSYAAAVDVTKTFTINQHTQIITFNPPATQTFAPAGTVALVAFSDGSDNPISFVSTSTGVCTVLGSTVTFVSAGICAIIASEAGDISYFAATNVPKSFAINLAAQAITATPYPTSIPYLATGQITVLGQLGTSAIAYVVKSGTCTVSVSGLVMAGAGSGTCVVTATIAADLNYLTASSDATIAMTKATQTIAFAQPANLSYAPNLTVTLSATTTATGLVVSYASNSATVCNVSGSTISILAAGSCSITASQVGSVNYLTAIPVTKIFATGQATQAISFTPPATQTYAPAGTVALVAKGGASGNAVTFASTSSAVCTTGGTNGATVTFVSAGICALTASQAGNTNYSAAPNVSASFTIALASQTITITSTPPKNAYVSAPAYTMIAAGGASTNPVTFSAAASSAGVCTVAGSSVSLTGVGTCTINANQAGNGNYTAAAQVQQSFAVADVIGPTTQAIGTFLSNRANLLVTNQPSFDRSNRLDDVDQGNGGSNTQMAEAKSDAIAPMKSSRLGASAAASGAAMPTAGLGATGAAAKAANSDPDAYALQSFLYNYLHGMSQGGDAKSVSLSGPMSLNASFGTMSHASFKTSLSQMMGWENDREQKQMQALGIGSSYAKPAFMPFDVWAEAQYTNYSGNTSGQLGLVTLGADYTFNRNLLVGVYGQVDAMNQTTGTSVSGTGYMVGPYSTIRLTDHMFFDLRGGYGGSSNNISPLGTYVNNFGSTRWLASSALTGKWKLDDGINFTPSASVTYFQDTSNAYVDSNSVLIPSVQTLLGQLKLSPEVSYDFAMDNGTTIEPSLAPQLIWNFASTNVNGVGTLAGTTTGPQGARGAVKAGLNFKTKQGLSISASGTYEGIGSSGYSAISAQAQVNVPLN